MQSKNYLQQGAVAGSPLNQPILTLNSNEGTQKQQKGLEGRSEKKELVSTYTFSYGGWMGYRGGYEGL